MKINLTIERFEDTQAVLTRKDGLCVSWPKTLLPEGAKKNDVIFFNLELSAAAAEDSGCLAKDILNEILKAE